MGRRRRALALLSAVIVLGGTLIASPAIALEPTDQVTVFKDTTFGDGDGIRTPDVISTSEDDVVVAWRQGSTNNQFDNGAIRYARSSDGGATWTPPATLAAKDATYGWHYVIFYKVGTTIYAILGRTPADSRNGMPVTSFMKKSTDNGATWTNHTADFSGVPAGFVIAGRPILYNGVHIAPFWNAGKVAVMRSTDLVTWTAGAYAPDPLNTGSGENQLVVDPENVGRLIMFNRVAASANAYLTGPVYTSRTESSDGGLTWSALTFDQNIPNMGTKGYVTRDSAGRLLAVYNTMGGMFPSPLDDRPAHWRSILNFKVKEQGEPWGPGRFLADEPPVVNRPHSAGWDTYAMGDEYAPGKFFIAWESDTAGIELVKLDLNREFRGVNENWDALGKWSVSTGGGTAVVSNGRLQLANSASTTTRVSQPTAPLRGFVAAFSGKITAGGALNSTTGVGAALGMEVVGGTHTLTLSAQPDGVYAKTAASNLWTRVHAAVLGTTDHQIRVTVDDAGRARLYFDSVDVGVEWTLPVSSTTRRSSVFTSGTAGTPSAASVNWASVEDNIVSSGWASLAGWSSFNGGGSIAGGELTITSDVDGQRAISRAAATKCDFTLDFRGRVTDYAPLNATDGKGASMAILVSNESRRLMLSIQSDGVYAIRKGETGWTRVHALANAGALASWRVDTSSGGEAALYRNGIDTGARWTIQDSDVPAQVRLWSSGNGADTSQFKMDWLRTTCEIR